jgi:hypothetical protein
MKHTNLGYHNALLNLKGSLHKPSSCQDRAASEEHGEGIHERCGRYRFLIVKLLPRSSYVSSLRPFRTLHGLKFDVISLR